MQSSSALEVLFGDQKQIIGFWKGFLEVREGLKRISGILNEVDELLMSQLAC